MRKVLTVIVFLSVGIAVFVGYRALNRRTVRPVATISPLTFEQIDRSVQSSPSVAEVKQYSQRLRGTRVRWSGTVTGIEEDGTVYVASNIFPTNIQFELPKDIAVGLPKGQMETFIGTIRQVTEIDTAPPMVHTYVILKEVRLQGNRK